MKRLILGDYADGSRATIDIPRLLETRLLIQAASGFGKSWAVRKLCEVAAGQVQQFIIDPDGEYPTLREKHDYVIAAAHDGDALAHPKTAALLARKLLETGVSAILDIYDLKAHERHAFVRNFCAAMVDAPKTLWHPVMVVLDEAHVYCPEQGESEAAAAVIDLATRGRKRGYGLVMATQRLSKLNKDAAAECINKMIGRASLDVDIKRAAADLGYTPKDMAAMMKTVDPGHFFAFGPAMSPEVQQLTVGQVETTHPKAGQRMLQKPPRPTAAIKAVLPQLADLPKEAEQEAKTVDDLRRELTAVRRELTASKKSIGGADSVTVKRLRQVIGDLMKFVVRINAEGFDKGTDIDPADLRKGIDAAMQIAIGMMQGRVATRDKALQKLQADAGRIVATAQKLLADDKIDISVDVAHREPFAVATTRPKAVAAPTNGNLPIGEASILRACIQYPDGLEREQLTVLTGYRRSSRDAYIARVSARGYVTTGDKIRATDEGISAMPDAEPLPSGAELQDFWRSRLPIGERKILDVLIDAYPEEITRDSLDEPTGFQRSSRDAYLSRLAAKQLVIAVGRGMVKASENLF